MKEFFQACAEYPFWAGSLFTLVAWVSFWVCAGWEPIVSVKRVMNVVEPEKEEEKP